MLPSFYPVGYPAPDCLVMTSSLIFEALARKLCQSQVPAAHLCSLEETLMPLPMLQRKKGMEWKRKWRRGLWWARVSLSPLWSVLWAFLGRARAAIGVTSSLSPDQTNHSCADVLCMLTSAAVELLASGPEAYRVVTWRCDWAVSDQISQKFHVASNTVLSSGCCTAMTYPVGSVHELHGWPKVLSLASSIKWFLVAWLGNTSLCRRPWSSQLPFVCWQLTGLAKEVVLFHIILFYVKYPVIEQQEVKWWLYASVKQSCGDQSLPA